MKNQIILFLLAIVISYSINGKVMDTANRSTEIVFASDTQAPMWIEALWLRSNHNRSATRSIFDDIVERHPASVYLLGDVVSLGSSNRQWKPVDAHLQRLRGKGVKVSAILGNHEVMGRPGMGQRKFQQRFPDHLKTGFVDVTDSVAVILLNSNFSSLSRSEDLAQNDWYRQTLQQLDADPAIRFIITGCHHSPYSNSKIVGSSMGVRQRFVPAFLHSKKSRLFLSGHSHNFEHFKQHGKDFLVIGGGGGLHQPLRPGEGILQDFATNYKPLFHYLTIQRQIDVLTVKSVRLTDTRSFEEGATFTIAANRDAS